MRKSYRSFGLPQATVATDNEVLGLIQQHVLHDIRIGYVDAHLLAATRLTPDARSGPKTSV